MLPRLFLMMALFATTSGFAQPYIDVAAVRYQYSPDAGAFRRNQAPNHFSYGNVGVNVPIVFKDSSILLFSPLMEKWEITSPAMMPKEPMVLKGMLGQVAFQKTLPNRWTATFGFLPRWNGEDFSFNNSWLPAGVVLVGHKISSTLSLRVGGYLHKELYGTGFIPLGGIDWTINNSTKLFGLLPGSLTLEKKATSRFYYGAAFRALTASYHFALSPLPEKLFVRIDENQLNAFADVYVTKNIVLNAEAGHSILRRFRYGVVNTDKQYGFKQKFNDDLLFRIAVFYRVRLDGK